MNELTPRIRLDSPLPTNGGLITYGWKECAKAGGAYGSLTEHFVAFGRPRGWENRYILELGGVQCPLKLRKGRWCVKLPCGYAPLGQFLRMGGWTEPGGPSFQCRCGPKSLKEPYFKVQVTGRKELLGEGRWIKYREVRLCPACYAVFEDSMLEKGFAR